MSVHLRTKEEHDFEITQLRESIQRQIKVLICELADLDNYLELNNAVFDHMLPSQRITNLTMQFGELVALTKMTGQFPESKR